MPWFYFCSQSIEIDEYRRLIQKERNAQELLGDPIATSFTRELLLDEALASLGHFEKIGASSNLTAA